jgi:hypothetical protein
VFYLDSLDGESGPLRAPAGASSLATSAMFLSKNLNWLARESGLIDASILL